MTRRTGIVLALDPPGGDAMVSRLPTYLHPLAGRPLIHHALRAVAEQSPSPDRLLLVGDRTLHADWIQEISVDAEIVDPSEGDVGARILDDAATGREEEFLVVDGAAPLVADCLGDMAGDSGRVCLTGRGRVVAGRLDASDLRAVLESDDHLGALVDRSGIRTRTTDRVFVVRSRQDLATATERCRDRIVSELMEQGVTFLLPDSILVDIDVTIGPDALIYPHVVLEGSTSVGRETVIGPGCRIVNSRVGSGVELKGWNYISHTSIRNRAILEPYVRRGYD